jgi:proteasome activator subunit 3 (PA28 gamma)
MLFRLEKLRLHLCSLFQLKMWISFMIPKIEDGNNFGVSIQEDTLGEIQSVESEAAAFFDQISRYFVSRGKIVSKVDVC